MTCMAKTSAFTNEFLDEIRQLLGERKQRLEIELGMFAKKNPHATDDYDAQYSEYGDKEDENAQEVAEFTTNKPLELTLEKELRDISKSMSRIDEGTYGICKYCDKPIDEKRLLARPTSGSCVDCKKALTNEI